MKPMCEANCGKHTAVYGNKYCPECHDNYAPACFPLVFRPKAEAPRQSENQRTALLLNKCDGYHVAYIRFFDDGEFDGFYSFTGIEYETELYAAWAVLPDEVNDLHSIFAKDT